MAGDPVCGQPVRRSKAHNVIEHGERMMIKSPMDTHCHIEPVNKIASAKELSNKASAFLSVWGMGCPNCAMRVRNGLVSLDGVVDAFVDHRAGMAWVIFNPDLVCPPALTQAVERAGRDSNHEYWAVVVAQ